MQLLLQGANLIIERLILEYQIRLLHLFIVLRHELAIELLPQARILLLHGYLLAHQDLYVILHSLRLAKLLKQLLDLLLLESH